MANGGIRRTLHGAVLERFQQRYGGLPQVTVTPITFAGAGNGISVAPADPERVFLALINIGAAPLAVLPSSSVSSSTGFVLGGPGGALLTSEQEDTLMPALEWFAGVPSGGQLLLVISVRRDVKVAPVENEG